MHSIMLRFFTKIRFSLLVIPILLLSIGRAFTQTDFKPVITLLSSPAMGGRFPGSEADSVIREMIAGRYRMYGLSPISDSYYQRFKIPYNYYFDGRITLSKGQQESQVWMYGTDFSFGAWNRSDSLSLLPIFGGFMTFDTLTIPKQLHNTACFVFHQNQPKYRHIKAWIAEHTKVSADDYWARSGVKALLYVLPPGMQTNATPFSGGQRRETDLLHVDISYPVFERIVGKSKIKRHDKAVFASKSTDPIPLKNQALTITCQKHASFLQTANIMGVKPGINEQYIIIGAHHDHIGYQNGELHPGANDNASGIAMLLELAKQLSEEPTDCNLLFIAFGAEERGLLGSRYFWNHLPIRKEQIKTMINLDMVGDMDDNLLFYQSGKNFRDAHSICSLALRQAGNTIRVEQASAANRGLSDNYVFESNGIPTFYFHTGILSARKKSTLHTPQDTEEKINYCGMEKVLSFLRNLILTVDKQSAIISEKQ